MPRYTVQHRYQSGIYGPWPAGHVIEVEEAEAEWINHDSPGCLAPEGPKPVKPGFERARQAPTTPPAEATPPTAPKRGPGRPRKNPAN